MKQLKVILVTFMVFLLVACGGGGTPQADPRNPTALFTNAGSSLTMPAASASVSYAISGGIAPYSASSSNARVALTSVNGTSFSVTPVSEGSATIRVFDAKGSSVDISVTVASGAPVAALYTTAASAITMGVGGAGSYAIAGGTAPYAATSSNNAVVSAGVNGRTLNIVSGTSGNAQVLVFDANGAQVVINVTVGSAAAPSLYTTAPSAITMSGDAGPASFLIRGGVPPYGASTSNAAVATATVNGADLSVRSVANGSATLLVIDSVGSKVEISVVVGVASGSVPLSTTAPSLINMDIDAVLNYTVSGGKAPYSARTSNYVVAGVNLVGTTLVVTGWNKGSASIFVLDSTNTEVLINVIVGAAVPSPLYMTAPASITMASGAAPATYTIGGGTPPYAAGSSNTSVLTATVTGGTLSLNGIAAGNASVDVLDASGAKVSTSVTVSAVAGAALSVLPSGATGNVGDTLTFTLLGGAPPYNLRVSNTSIASVSPTSVASSGGTFSASLRNVGDTVVTVLDAQGQTTSFVLSVGSMASQLRLSPSVFLVGENETGAITLNIFGGTPPYRALTSDLVKSAVVTAGSTLTTDVGTSGNRCINPVTAEQPPVYITSGTYDVTLTVIDSLGASAISSMTIKDNGAGLGLGCP